MTGAATVQQRGEQWHWLVEDEVTRAACVGHEGIIHLLYCVRRVRRNEALRTAPLIDCLVSFVKTDRLRGLEHRQAPNENSFRQQW